LQCLRFLLLCLVRAAIGLGDRAPDTALVGHGDVMIAQKVAGGIVRHEMVVKAPISGRVTYAARENVRVPINSKLLEIKRDNIDTDLTDKYKEINDKLQVLQSLEDNSAPAGCAG
jgi:hypothetical protein